MASFAVPLPIPAPAGEPCPSSGASSAFRVYPRAWGSTRSGAGPGSAMRRFTPAARGLPLRADSKEMSLRFIPAARGPACVRHFSGISPAFHWKFGSHLELSSAWRSRRGLPCHARLPQFGALWGVRRAVWGSFVPGGAPGALHDTLPVLFEGVGVDAVPSGDLAEFLDRFPVAPGQDAYHLQPIRAVDLDAVPVLLLFGHVFLPGWLAQAALLFRAVLS